MPGLRLEQLRKLSSSVIASAAPPIGVDFGTSALKVLQISSAESPNLIAAASIPTPEELLNEPQKRLAFQLEQLQKLTKSGQLRGKRAACAIPASHTYCKHLQIQPDASAELGSMVRAAVAGQLGCLPDALVCRHIEVGPAAGSGKTEIIALAASRGVVQQMMAGLRAAKLEPVGIHPECTAVLRCFDHITRRAEDSELTSLYLDLGASSTRVIIAQGRQVVFAKTISIGGHFLDHTVARQLRCDQAEARKHRLALANLAKETKAQDPLASAMPAMAAGMSQAQAGARKSIGQAVGGAGAGATATAAEQRSGQSPAGYADVAGLQGNAMAPGRADLSEPLDALTDEIAMCVRYHDTINPGRKIARLVFIGGESRHVALCQHIAKVLRVPAHVADPLARLGRSGEVPVSGLTLGEPQPGWAVALGVSLSPTDL
jgi:type IV pilus assembly protein PilM